jgi:hypothetical protein
MIDAITRDPAQLRGALRAIARIFQIAISKRDAYRFFCLKFSIFPFKKVKSANRTVFKIKVVLAF